MQALRVQRFLQFFIALAVLMIISCDRTHEEMYTPSYGQAPSITKQEFIFGIHPLHNPKRLFEIYQPLIDYLNAHLGEKLFRLEASKNYDEFDKKLFSGHFDFALPNPYQTLQSLEYGYTVFAKMGDDQHFRGIILVRKDTPVQHISELKGKIVSFPAQSALAATIMPQRFLHDHGLNIMHDIQSHYVGSQESFLTGYAYVATAPLRCSFSKPGFSWISTKTTFEASLRKSSAVSSGEI